MPDASHLLAFLGATCLLAVIPGPGMLFVLAGSISGGTGAGLRATAGTSLGGLVHVVAAAAGLSALIVASAGLFEVVRIAGAAYLIWLGFSSLRHSTQVVNVGSSTATHPLRQGAITEVLNPKTALFFLTFLPQFVQPDHGAVAVQLVALGVATVLLNSAVDVLVATMSGRLASSLRRSPKWWKRQRIGSGLILMGLGGAAAVNASRNV